MNSSKKEYDTLTSIKGISRARQQWLRDSFNVRTFADLAALSPDEIEAQLKAEGRNATRRDVEEWIAQAQAYAARTHTVQPGESSSAAVEEKIVSTSAREAEGWPALTQLDAELQGRTLELEELTTQAYATTPQPGEAATAAVEEKKELTAGYAAAHWQPFAQFGVEFQKRTLEDTETVGQAYQTAVHHIETGVGTAWPGIESEQLCGWMAERVHQAAGQEVREASAVVTAPMISAPTRVTVTQVRVFQPPDAKTLIATGKPDQPLDGVIAAGKPFTLEAAIELAEAVTSDPERSIAYSAQFYVRTLGSKESSQQLDVTGPTLFTPGKTSFTARSAAVSLQRGTYRLQLLVSVQSVPPTLGFLEIPLLQVA